MLMYITLKVSTIGCRTRPHRRVHEVNETVSTGDTDLVSTYLGVNFGHLKSEVFHWVGGEGYWGVNFGHPKSEVFYWGGGVFRGVNFGHPKSEVFHLGGGISRSKLWSSQI